MFLAKVVGSVVATQKYETLVGKKLLICKKINETEEFEKYSSSSTLVAIDAVGAGQGETVLIAQGSSARFVEGNKITPVDATVVGIVDSIET
jgi:ethanolamine utilization protein EutN